MTDRKIVEVNPSVIAAQVPVLIRQALLVVGGAVALVGFLSARDMAGLVTYLQSEHFMTALATAATLGSVAWGQWRAHRTNKTLTGIADDPANRNVVAIAPTPPPAVDTDA